MAIEARSEPDDSPDLAADDEPATAADVEDGAAQIGEPAEPMAEAPPPVVETTGMPEPSDPVDRDLAALDLLDEMSLEQRQTYDTLEAELTGLIDNYDRALLAMRLGDDPAPDDVEKEVARLLRNKELAAGQQDMFGATAAEPDALLLPDFLDPAAVFVDSLKGAETPPVAEPAPEPATYPGLEDDIAQVEAVTADGVVTSAEAEETASAAARVMSAAERDTPDSPEPERGYDSEKSIAQRIRELCHDPAEMQEVLARARDSRTAAGRQRRGDTGIQVPSDARTAASAVMQRRRADSGPTTPKGPRQVRISDVDMLRRAVEHCGPDDAAAVVAKQAREFLASGGNGKTVTPKFDYKPKQPDEPKQRQRRSGNNDKALAGVNGPTEVMARFR